MQLSVAQQYLFNYFNLVNVATLKSTLDILKQIQEKLQTEFVPNEAGLNKEIASINAVIRQYDLDIVETIDEITSEKLYVLINTADNVVSQKSKFYETSVTKMFSEIIKDCVLSEEGYITETHCLNLNTKAGVSKSGAVGIIEKLIQDKWLVLMNDKVSLSMRSIIELKPNLKQLYQDEINNCPLCKLIIIQGYICSHCKIRCHNACFKKYYSHAKGNCFCPNCKEEWNEISFTDEDFSKVNKSSTTTTTYGHVPTKRRKKSSVPS